jgi:hypothetical protein
MPRRLAPVNLPSRLPQGEPSGLELPIRADRVGKAAAGSDLAANPITVLSTAPVRNFPQ